VGPEIFVHYPINRRLAPAEEDVIAELLTVQPNAKRVKELIKNKFRKCITLKGISNLKAKVKERTRKGLEEPQALLMTLQDITTENAQAGIVVNEDNVLQICYLQTTHMKRLYSRFPEIMFIDGTYNVNGHGMPLYCIMVEDGYGHGRVVYYAATTEEDTLHLRKISPVAIATKWL